MSTRRTRRDEGSALVLALVMMVIGSLVVGGVATYAISVFRANHTLSDRTQRAEAVKAGMRMALSYPRDLYEYCGPAHTGATSWRSLAPITVNGYTVNTQCHTIDVAAAQGDDERRFGLVATKLGETIPEELVPAVPADVIPALPPTRYDLSTATDTDQWLADTDEQSVTGKIWRPRLPSHGISPRSPSGTQMPVADGWPECRVFFPGTYTDPVILDGPTFFTAGVYYFENTVTVIGGAEVVVGDGSTPGCVTSQDALYYAERVPGEHNVNGYGATFVFGDEGRLVITNDPTERDRANVAVGAQPISFVINRRYNKEDDFPFLPSSDVAIITVDGELQLDSSGNVVTDGDGDPVGLDLSADGRIYVPQSIVGADDPDIDGDQGTVATKAEYRPSIFTPKPRRPDAPTWPSTNALQKRGSGRVLVTWNAPPFDGGTPITGYRVTADPGGQTCETNGALSCVVTGLPTGSAVTFSVVAFNQSDPADPDLEVASLPSDPSSSITANNSGSASAPSTPSAPTVRFDYDDQLLVDDPMNSVLAHVEWSPATGGNVPVTGYTVTLEPLDPVGPALTCSIDVTDSWIPDGETVPYPQADDLECDIPIPVVSDAASSRAFAQYRATLTATNAIGQTTSTPLPIPAIAKNRIDMPEMCLNLAGVISIGTPANGTVEADELAAWLTGTALPSAICASPAFAGSGYSAHVAHELPTRDGQPPTPVVEIDLVPGIAKADNPVEVNIGSYLSLAQGRIKVDNPQGHDVNITGGILAAMYDVTDARNTGPGTVKIGYEAAEIQRKMEIVSTTHDGRTTSTAIVQINQTGAWAVNSWRLD